MKVLIAEDDQFIREALRDILQAEGYQCVLAEDGEQALVRYSSDGPELALLDIMMPRKDGYAVCREIRQQDQLIPIIFISAKSEEIDRVVGLELGADDYIMKPFGKHEVVARIRAVTRRYLLSQQTATNEDDGVFAMAGLAVYPQELRAERSGERMELSLRDVKILRCLYDLRNQVVSRDQLFNQCWGRNYVASSRTLDQHISKLRKQIELDPREPEIIKTVHGVGYRYEE